MPTPIDWSRAFAKQAVADFDARDWLCRSRSLPVCQQLHFLQMACEKLCKAYLCAAGSDPADLQASHAYIAKVLPLIVRQQITRSAQQELGRYRWLMDSVKPLAREIELLAPSVTAGGKRRANCEYPWEETNGTVRAPAEHRFPNLQVLDNRAGRALLKIARTAAYDLRS